MNRAADGVKLFQSVQRAFQVIAMLQINAHMWPQQNTVPGLLSDNATFEFIVVGGGAAGCVVAARLAEDMKTRVLLVEAGGNPPLHTNIPGMMIYLDKSSVDWNISSTDDGYSCQCQSNRKLDLLMGKMLGGTASMDFLLFSQGNRRDYNGWAKLTNDTSWCWNKLKPYFTKAFNYYPSDTDTCEKDSNKPLGKISVTKNPPAEYDSVYLNGFREAGNKLVSAVDGRIPVGYSKSSFSIGNGIRQSTAFTYLRPVKDYPNLYVLKNTLTTKILFDKNKIAIGVELVFENGTVITVKASKEVIVSAGAINGPKLLMLSGVGPAKHLKSKGIKVISDLPVGENFQDHVAVTIIHNMSKLDAPMGTRDSRQYPAQVVTGYVNLDRTKDYSEYCSINFANYANYLTQFCAVTYGLDQKICDNLFDHPNKNQMLYTMINMVRPESRGSVRLQSKDYKDDPVVNTAFYSEKKDLDKMVEFIEDYMRVTDSFSFKAAGAEFADPKLSKCAVHKFKSKAYWRCYALCMMTSRRHYVGTSAMGSVVDSRLRVLGVNRLRVVGPSVMPWIRTETFGPTVVVAEKAADMIKADNGIEDTEICDTCEL